MKMSAKQLKVHKAFLDLKKPYDPTDVYTAFCKLVGLTDDHIERGLGKLFRENKLRPPADRPRKVKRSARSSAPADDFR